ncbi:MarR family winged helix-turn-helix transcriptional regulator [Glycomyces algeriensis]|uniref:MarR family transcriptional regulator n=1 Tax=Glycomyces algeriensis TaxID=256037 RepID=A0A9W6GBU4_9ACTN|nr:MarR family transcriptional regulator [Glycomyces algeriensis]MDA1365632.1 MarR family transcriptional regulator [Glycomyces algeriensis]MDR7351320.1 DNA-binding MarR family transcriptional regulator [Glycomyces algeriensis]GLI44036.1 MarR family transcriptional regulator [Glycomyces algeriensis]
MGSAEVEPSAEVQAHPVIWALRRAEMALQSVKEQRLRPLGIAPSHYALLMTVHGAPGLTGAELARRLHVTPQAVASLVAKLAERGWLERRSHSRHQHVQELHLTDEGRKALEDADAEIAAMEQRITERLGAESADQLVALLDAVMETVREPQS